MTLRRLTNEIQQTAADPSSNNQNVDYKALYRARVVTQNIDETGLTSGTLELAPLDTRFSTFSNVPIMLGAPGVTVTVEPGSYVFFTFWNGHPGQVYVASWDPMNAVVTWTATAETIALNPNSGSSTPAAARVGDLGRWDPAWLATLGEIITAFTGAPPPATLPIIIATGSSSVVIGG